MPRKKIAAGNWKMNTTPSEGVRLAKAVAKKVPADNSSEVVFAAPFTHLMAIRTQIKGHRKVKLAAQDCSAHPAGAYTGEVSTKMLRSIGVNYVLVGHSERRMYHQEDNQLLATKIDQVLAAGMKTIFCCGEPLSVRKAKGQKRYVAKQIRQSLFHLKEAEIKKIVIAYEPIWAIGTGLTASPEQAQQMHRYIRQLLEKKYGSRIAANTTILYGGSVKPGNASTLFSQPDVDGGLVGGASLKAQGFTEIIRALNG